MEINDPYNNVKNEFHPFENPLKETMNFSDKKSFTGIKMFD